MKDVLKFLAFRVFAPLLLFFGIDKLLRQFSRHNRLVIFLHGVSRNKEQRINGRNMDVEQFERILKYLKSNFDILPVEALCNPDTRISRKTVALSFDDGLLNNIDVALPMLMKYGIPATFFVSSECLVDAGYMHPPDLVDLLKHSLTSNEVSIGREKFYLSGDELLRKKDGRKVLEYMNGLSFPALLSMMEDIQSGYDKEFLKKGVDPESYQLMSPENLRKINSNDLITIGSHSHYHVSMNVLSATEIDEQLALSRETLQRHANRPVKSFAFPYGHFTEGAVKAVVQNGFEYIFAAGDVTPPNNRVLPRVGILSMRGFAYNILSINSAFGRFGF